MFWLYVIDIKDLVDSNIILFKFYFDRDKSQRVTFCMLIIMLLYFISFSLPQEKEEEKRQLQKIIYFPRIEDLNIVKCFVDIKVALINLLKH